jgi:hypothetical protein
MEIVLSPELENKRIYEPLVAAEMLRNVGTHNNQTDGFSRLELDTDKYPFQRIDCRHVIGENATPNKLRETAQLIVPSAEQIIEYLVKEREDLLNHASDKIETEGKLKIVTNHENVIGVMVLGGAFLCAMYEKNYFKETDIKTALFVSDMIKFTQLHGMDSTVNILGGLITDTFFTQPPTKSIKNTSIPREVSEKVNEVAVKEHQELEESDEALITIMAGSGTRDVYKGRKFGNMKTPPTVHMGPIAYGTNDLLKTSWSIPAGLDMRKPEKQHYFFGKMTKPTSENIDSHIVMNEIQEGMTKTTGVLHKYHSERKSFYDAID